jgi:hypothetical protein
MHDIAAKHNLFAVAIEYFLRYVTSNVTVTRRLLTLLLLFVCEWFVIWYVYTAMNCSFFPFSRYSSLLALEARVTGEWRKLHNEELNDLYSFPNILRVIKSRKRWAGHAARMGERRGEYRALVGKPEGKRPLGTARSRWEDKNKMDFQEVDVGA